MDQTSLQRKSNPSANNDAPALHNTGAGKGVSAASVYGAPVQRKADPNATTPAVDAGARQVEITASVLNVRSAPDSSKPNKVGVLKQGEKVEVTGTSGAWLEVQFAGSPAYVHGSYTKPVATAKPETDNSATATATDSSATATDNSGDGGMLGQVGAGLMDLWGAATGQESGQENTWWDSVVSFFSGSEGEGETKIEDTDTDIAARDKTPENDGSADSENGTENTPEQDNAAPSGAVFNSLMTVRDAKALIREPDTFKSTGASIPQGSQVYVIAAKKSYVQIISAPGQEYQATAEDKIWTSIGNLAAGGADVGMGNERTNEEAKQAAGAITASLPQGRNPGANSAKVSFSGGFAMSYDGISLRTSLMDKVMRMAQWAIQNDMVTGDITLGDGMRPPSTAHRMSVAWHLQYDSAYKGLERVKQLPGGKDKDGTKWYQDGWTDAQVKSNANGVRSSSAIAAEGYPFDDDRRAPNPVSGRDGLPSMGVSRHCSGGAVDITFPWRMAGAHASENKKDVWGWDNILAQFGLYRPLPKGHKYEEFWHLEETDLQLDPDAPPTENS